MFHVMPASGIQSMDLAGVEPASESPFIKASPITVSLPAFPPPHAERQAYGFSSFIDSFAPAKLKGKSASQFMMPGSQAVSNPGQTAAIKRRVLNYLQRLYLGLPFDPLHGDSFTSCMTPVETSTSPYWPSYEAEIS